MEINNNKFNSLPQQVEENMKNIHLLAQYLKESYKTGLTLSPSDTTIAISNTNADDSVQDGWLFDSIGNLFKITGGDGTNFLIEFYTCFRGQDGRDGVNDIDDNTTANNKLWSSQKIYNELLNYSDRGIYYTTTPPTLVSADVYSINRNQVPPFNVDIPVKQDDLLLLVDNYTKEVKTLYSVISEINGVISLYKHAEFSSGKQLYQHNISLSSAGSIAELDIFIINDNPNAMTLNDLKTWLNDKGYTYPKMYKHIGGYITTSSTPQKYIVGGLRGVFYTNGNVRVSYMEYGSSWTDVGLNFTTLDEDDVMPL